MTLWNRRRWVWALLLAGICAVGWALPVWAQADAQVGPDLSNQTAAIEPGFVPGVVLVGVRGDAAQSAGLGALAPQALLPLDLRGLDGGQGDDGVVGLRLQVAPGTEWAAIEQLRQDPAVVFAEPDWLAVTAQAAPQAAAETPFIVGDGLYDRQWYLQRINMSRAWSVALNETGRGLTTIKVAVLDTGVDLTHPDLAAHLSLGRNYLVPGTAPTDDNGHGTHVAGLIAGVLNNGGIAGTALQVRVDPIKVLYADGSGPTTAIAEAMRDVADGDARIINLSLQLSQDSVVMRSAVAYAVSRGVLVVAAAGNCYFDPNTGALVCPPPVQYPAAYPDVVTVAASSYFDTRAHYSAVGPQVDLSAPGGASGQSILSTWSSHPAAVRGCKSGLVTLGDAYYCPADGTSMAAGIVTGVAALVLSVRPELTAAEVADLLEETAFPIDGSANEIGVGRIDAARAVRQAIAPHLTGLPSELAALVEPDDPPVRLTVALDNPGLEPLTWSITRTAAVSWFVVDGPVAGVVSYGAPAATQIVITPTELVTGTNLGGLRLTTVAPDGGQTVYQIGVRAKAAAMTHTHVPLLSGGVVPYAWLEPGPDGRVVYTMTGASNVAVSLPFAFSVRGRAFSDVRIYSDGLITFPASTVVAGLPNRCLTNAVTPGLAVYGWWADLNPGAVGSRISVFQPDADRFVVEYHNIPSAPGIIPAYVVDFQIVLHRDGAIRLTYRNVPAVSLLGAPSHLTIGVEAVDGRYANQIVCRTGDLRLGDLPQREQTLLIRPEELY